MNTLEFLGGKYQDGEQILPGAIQTYRAVEVATARHVYVHRVASSDDAHEQLALYRLMSAALIRSPQVRSMILDIREDSRDWFVVTEIAPQCLLLREWLQFELDNASKPAETEKKQTAPVAAAQPSAPAKPEEEPGEFTRFFRGNVTSSNTVKTSTGERPSRTGVQRPNTPLPFAPPATARKDEPGEFTKLFNRPLGESAPSTPPPSAPRPQQSPDDFDNLFGPRTDQSVQPVASPAPGEYTRIFGKNNVPPPAQTAPGLGERTRTDLDDPLASAGPSTNINHSPVATPGGPSEYTRVISGNRPQATGESAAAAAPSSANISLPSGLTPPAVPPLPTAPPVSAVPPPAMPTPALKPALPKPAMNTPAVTAPANKNLIIFLSVLGLLALILILVVVFAIRK